MKKFFLTSIVLILFASLACFFSCNHNVNKSNNNILTIRQTANHSSGDYWAYEMDTDKILKETNYSESQFIGPGYTQIWEFTAIDVGKVTIKWIFYKGGHWEKEDKSYSITYIIDKSGIHQFLSYNKQQIKEHCKAYRLTTSTDWLSSCEENSQVYLDILKHYTNIAPAKISKQKKVVMKKA